MAAAMGHRNDGIELRQPFAGGVISGPQDDLVLVHIHQVVGRHVGISTGSALDGRQVHLREAAHALADHFHRVHHAEGTVQVAAEIDHVIMGGQNRADLGILCADGVVVDDDGAVSGQRAGIDEGEVVDDEHRLAVGSVGGHPLLQPGQSLVLIIAAVADGVQLVALDGIIAVLVQNLLAGTGLQLVVRVHNDEVEALVADGIAVAMAFVGIRIIVHGIQGSGAAIYKFLDMGHDILPIHRRRCQIIGIRSIPGNFVVAEAGQHQQVLQAVLLNQCVEHIIGVLGGDRLGIVGKVAAVQENVRHQIVGFQIRKHGLQSLGIHVSGSGDVNVGK